MGVPEVAEAEAAVRGRAPLRLLLFLIVFSPAVILGFAVAENAVDVPMWDDWERGGLWERHRAGTLDFNYLDSPHIEHRILTGRLAMLAGGLWFGGDLRFEIWLTYAVVLATALLCFYLLRYTLGVVPALWPAALLVNLLLFCPQQYANFLWAIQFAYMVPFFCLAAILAAWVSPLPLWCKTSFGVLMALVGTHSFSQGLMLWPVALGMPLCSPAPGSLRRRVLPAAAVALVMAAALAYHFGPSFRSSSHFSHTHGIETGERPPSLGAVGEAMGDLDAAGRYLLSSLGNPLARAFGSDQRDSAFWVGCGLLLLSAGAAAFAVWRRRDGEIWARLLPWFAAAGFAVAVAFLLALGRSATDRAAMPHYISMTQFLVIALVAIAAYVANWWVRSAGDGTAAGRRAAYAWGAAVASAVLLVNLWVYGLYKMEAWKGSRLQARAALTYIRLFEPTKIGRLDATLEFVREGAEVMDSQGLIHPPLAREWGFGPYRPQRGSLGQKRAKVTRCATDALGVHVDGYALLPDGRIADGVLISVRAGDGDGWRVIGFAEMRSLHALNNIFLDTQFGQGPNLAYIGQYARFRGRADLPDDFSPTDTDLLCWALDAERFVAFPIGDAVPIADQEEPAPDGQ